MSVWVFVIILCCPAKAEHTIRWSAPTMDACWTMQRVMVREVKGFGLRATVSECREETMP